MSDGAKFTKAMAEELFQFFQAGASSAQGSLLARARDGLPHGARAGRAYEPRDEDLDRANENRAVARALATIGTRNAYVLRLYHSRKTTWPKLEAFGRWGGLAHHINAHAVDDIDWAQKLPEHVTTSDSEDASLLNDIARAKSGAGRELYTEIVAKARTLLKEAEGAYAEARGAVSTPKQKRVFMALVTIREAARRLDKGETTVKAMLADGRLAFRMVGARKQHRRVVLTSETPFPEEIGRETRGRKKILARAEDKK